MSRRGIVIVNPVAGKLGPRRKLDAAIQSACAEFDLALETVVTEAPGEATELAARAEAAGSEIIIACGGDGTLNEVINGVRSTDVTVGQIPCGTVNIWAKEAGIPRQAGDALRAQLTGPSLLLDTGRVGGRRFLLMASYGLDAAAVAAVPGGLKRRLGSLAYVVAGMRVGLRYSGFRVTLELNGDTAETVDATMMVFGNTRLYGGVARITREASAVDGLLDCVIFRGHGPWATLRLLLPVLRGRHPPLSPGPLSASPRRPDHAGGGKRSAPSAGRRGRAPGVGAGAARGSTLPPPVRAAAAAAGLSALTAQRYEAALLRSVAGDRRRHLSWHGGGIRARHDHLLRFRQRLRRGGATLAIQL